MIDLPFNFLSDDFDKTSWDYLDLVVNTKLNPLKASIKTMFPINSNIGSRMMEIQKNMFVNDFLYDIMGESMVK